MAFELKSQGNITITSKEYAGDEHLTQDDAELIRLGKKPVLKRNFGLLSMLGFGCNVMITWEAILALLSVSLINGGFAGSVYGYLVVWAGTLATFATMAEMASMAPTAGGQYHWVSILAPANCRVFLSYIIGWLVMIGWQAVVASGAFLSAELIQALMSTTSPDYAPQPWHTVLLFWTVMLVAVATNTVISRLLPTIEGMLLVLHVLAFVGIMIPLLYLAPHIDSVDVFTVFSNGGGWPTQGLSVLVGLVGPAFALLGSDGPVHMCEEISKPGRNVPRGIISSLLLNGLLGFGILLASLFCISDFDAVMTAPFPFVAIFLQAVGSTRGAVAMAALVVVMNVAATLTSLASASRMIWSFARDCGPPGWSYLRKIDQRTKLPLWSILVTVLISVLLSFIVLGSSVAFNDVISLTIGSLYTSYLIGNSLLLWRRINGTIKPYNEGGDGTLTNTTGADKITWGPWRIPEPLGSIVNAFGCIYMIVVLVFSFWPVTADPTPAAMNFSSLMVGVVIIFSVVYYFVWGKHTFKGPVVELHPE